MIVGTAGHIDHGKTSLIGKLTGVDTDRLKEEKARGISIDLGFAYWQRPGGETIGFVDVPGHEGLVHNMLAGATGIDFVMLVVAADDGVMPQTREHLAIVDLLGLTRGVVALNKCDLAGGDERAAAIAGIEAVLAGTGLEGAPIVPVSAVTGEGLPELTAILDASSAWATMRPKEGLFRLAVDRSFTLAGLGTAVSGTVLSGSVQLEDRVVVSPTGLEARIRSIHAQNAPVERGEAGQRCALVLSGPGISKDAVRRGDVVLDPALHLPTSRLDASLRVLPSERKPIGQWFPVKVHHAAAEVPGRVVVLRDAPIAPGETEYVQLVLERPLAAAIGDRFVIRDTSSSRTVGGGTLIDLRGPERRRRTPARRAEIEAMAEAEPSRALSRLLEGPAAWIDLDAFCRDRALGADAAQRLRQEPGLVVLQADGRHIGVLQTAWEQLRAHVGAALDAFHAQRPDQPGLGLEQLRTARKPALPAPLFVAAVRRMAEAGEVALDRTWVRRPGHEVRFSPEEERLWALMRPRLAGEPYRPPRVRDIAKAMGIDEALVRRLMHMAARRGDVEEIAHDHFFLRSVVQKMAEIAIDLAVKAPEGKFSAAEFRDRLDNGRKVAIQILEFFDRHGFTIRRQDLRRINPARIALFTPDAVQGAAQHDNGGVPLPVGRPDFKSGWGRQTVSGGFDSHPPPPPASGVRPLATTSAGESQRSGEGSDPVTPTAATAARSDPGARGRSPTGAPARLPKR
jgi:selenocysteine-specific elongation factor